MKPTPQDLAMLALKKGQVNIVDAILHFGRDVLTRRQWQALFNRCVRLEMLDLVRRGQLGSAAGPSVYAPTVKARAIALSIPSRESMAAAFAVPVSIHSSRPAAPGKYWFVKDRVMVDTGQTPERDLCRMEAGGGGFYVGPIQD